MNQKIGGTQFLEVKGGKYMATLYEWTGQGFEAQAKLQDILDDSSSTEEEKEAALAEYAAIKEAIEPKLESYLKILKNRSADVEALDTEIKRLQNKKNSAKADVERLRNSIMAAMQAVQKTKVKTLIGTFSLKESKKLITHLDEDDAFDEIPEEFLTPQPPKVDTKGLKAYLLEHPDVYMDAAEVVDVTTLSIR